MIECPRTGRAISTGIEMDRASFGASLVFFRRSYCPFCQTNHEWFAKDAWVREERRGGVRLNKADAAQQWQRSGSDRSLFHSESAMDERIFVARLNVKHYRQKLLTEQDAPTRQRIAQLLAEEEAKLATLSDSPGKNSKKNES
jgi:hypothetical protein